MSDNINIQEILKKYNKVFYEDSPSSTSTALDMEDVISVIKEAIELVVDRCKEEAKVTVQEINVGHDFEFTDTINVVDKQSILNVKNMIDYGKC